MKTTLDLDDRLLDAAKKRAAAEGSTLKAYVEDALRARLLLRQKRREPFVLRLPTVRGTRPPVVDIADRRALYDLLDERT